MAPEIKFKNTRRKSVAGGRDTDVTDTLRYIATKASIYIFPVRNKKAKPNNAKRGSITAASGNKYLHNDMKMYVFMVF